MRTKQNLKHLIKVDFMGIRTKIKNFQNFINKDYVDSLNKKTFKTSQNKKN